MVLRSHFLTLETSGVILVKKVGAKNENGGASDGWLTFAWKSDTGTGGSEVENKFIGVCYELY